VTDAYPVLAPVSEGYPKAKGRLLTCYSPVRRSSTPKGLSARLACVKHAASVRPEPGSNSPTKIEKRPQQFKEIARETKHILWHWLIKHPVEFSRNKHPPGLGFHQEASHPGQLPYFTRAVRVRQQGSHPLITQSARKNPARHSAPRGRICRSGGEPPTRPIQSPTRSDDPPGSLPA
jgi:hypothetical protein